MLYTGTRRDKHQAGCVGQAHGNLKHTKVVPHHHVVLDLIAVTARSASANTTRSRSLWRRCCFNRHNCVHEELALEQFGFGLCITSARWQGRSRVCLFFGPALPLFSPWRILRNNYTIFLFLTFARDV
jgi:hypothetical protein